MPPPATVGATGSAGVDASRRPAEAITRGESVPTEVHAAMAREEPVVEIDHFNLFYGQKQALHDVSMADSQESSHRADRSERLRKIDDAAQRESAE